MPKATKKITPKFDDDLAGFDRQTRMAIVANALREVSLTNPRILPVSVTRR